MFRTYGSFQFLIVRLKSDLNVMFNGFFEFQFLIVRLKSLSLMMFLIFIISFNSL